MFSDQYGEEIFQLEKKVKEQAAKIEQMKQLLSEAIHSLNLANYDQQFTTSKKQIEAHLLKTLGFSL